MTRQQLTPELRKQFEYHLINVIGFTHSGIAEKYRDSAKISINECIEAMFATYQLAQADKLQALEELKSEICGMLRDEWDESNIRAIDLTKYL